MHFSLVAVFVLLTALYTSASPTPDTSKWSRWTNSQRLARGLPPLPPKFGRTLPGMEARAPTPVGAKRGSPSPSPSPTPAPKSYTGRITVHPTQSHGSFGNVNVTGSGIAGVNTGGDPANDFYVTTSGSGPYVDLVATDHVWPTPYYVGALANSSTSLKSGSPDFATFARVYTQTSPNSPAKSGDESAIWTYNPTSGDLSPTFINPDGSKAPTTIGYDNVANQLFFVGDIDAYNKEHGNQPLTSVGFWLDVN